MRISDWSSDVCSSDLFIFWGFISGSILEGAELFSSNEGLIKQLPAPLSVHVYRLTWRQLIIFAHNIPLYAVLLIIFPQPSSDERRVGQECVRTCRSRRSPYH